MRTHRSCRARRSSGWTSRCANHSTAQGNQGLISGELRRMPAGVLIAGDRLGVRLVVEKRIERMVLPDRIELSTSPLPMECSTTELRQHARYWGIGANGRPLGGRFLPQGPLWRKHAGGPERPRNRQKPPPVAGPRPSKGPRTDPVPRPSLAGLWRRIIALRPYGSLRRATAKPAMV